MTFANPIAFWLLIIPALVAIAHLRNRMGLARTQTIATLLVRIAVLVAIVLALAKPVLQSSVNSHTTVLVADISASMSDADLVAMRKKLNEAKDNVRADGIVKLVVFDAIAREVDITGGIVDLVSLANRDKLGSSLAEALALAGAFIQHDGQGEIVLYSDGLATAGNALAQAKGLAQRGIRIKAHVVGSRRKSEVLLREVLLPDAGRVGETVKLTAIVEASEKTSAKLIIVDKITGKEKQVSKTLRQGVNTITQDCVLADCDVMMYDVKIIADKDTVKSNNSLPAVIRVLKSIKVSVIETASASLVKTELQKMLGLSAEVESLDISRAGDSDYLAQIDLLVLGDVPAKDLPAGVQESIRDAVRDGMGLVVTGGKRSLGPGGYAHGALAEAMPVRMRQKMERRDPSTTLVIILDTSGSMGSRISLAKEVARLALARLKPHDRAGIVEFYGYKRWAAPIQPASNHIDLNRALNRMTAGGGTVLLPAIEEAYFGLLNVRTRTRHVLILTDAGIERAAYGELLAKMTQEHIHVSTVLCGPRAGGQLLAKFAHMGRGRFYVASSRYNLPEIIFKQPDSSLLSPFVERESSLAFPEDRSVEIDVDLLKAPKITGYVETQIHPAGDMILQSDSGDPLLAQWQFGQGKVAVWTSHLAGNWTKDLGKWEGYPKLIAGLARRTARSPSSVKLSAMVSPSGVMVNISATDRKKLGASSPIKLAVSQMLSGSKSTTTIVDPCLPFRWQYHIPLPEAGTYLIDASAAEDATAGELAGKAAFVIAPEREIISLRPDDAIMAEMSKISGSLPAGESVTNQATQVKELWPFVAAAALVLFLLNILIRRFPMGRLSRGSAVIVLMIGFAVISVVSPAEASAAIPQDASESLGEALDSSSDNWQESFDRACRQTISEDGSLNSMITVLQGKADASTRAGEMLAGAFLREGQPAKAYVILTKLASSSKPSASILGAAARVAELLSKDDEALVWLGKALDVETDIQTRTALKIRQAQLFYDTKKVDQARDVFRSLIKDKNLQTGPVSNYCSRIAALCGDIEFAAEFFKPISSGNDLVEELMFRGTLLMMQDRVKEASVLFERALPLATSRHDQKYLLDRLIASARQAGSLDTLARRWIESDEGMTINRIRSILAVLSELGQADEALALIDTAAKSDDPKLRKFVESNEMQQEIIAIALDAGQGDRAEDVYRSLMKKWPNTVYYRIALARLFVLDGRRDEAIELFNRAIEETTSSGRLLAIAHGARSLALNELALAAASKASKISPMSKIQAILLESAIAREQGDADRALDLIMSLKPLTVESDRCAISIASALEEVGQKTDALEILTAEFERDHHPDVLVRVIGLHEELGNKRNAYELWKRCWEEATRPAQIVQSRERMMDLASRSGKLAALAIELEDKLLAGKGSDKELSLLVSIYCNAGDSITAVGMLMKAAAQGADEIETLERVAKAYYEGEIFGRCFATLRKLAVLNPDNAEDYLQQIAILAIEREQKRDAMQAVDDIRKLSSTEGSTDEFAAGVLGMLKKYADAARAYRRAIAKHPNRIETYLLWGNMMAAQDPRRRRGVTKTPHKDRAITTFQSLVETAEKDDLFTIAIDGMLNLDAPAQVLRSPLRRIRERIASSGGKKIYLYRLAADLQEELGDKTAIRRTLDLSLAAAGMRRGAILRELMTASAQEKIDRDVISYGSSLLNVLEHVPTDVSVQVAQGLLKIGKVNAAARAYRRAAVHGDALRMMRMAVSSYEHMGHSQQAYRTLNEMLLTNPDDHLLHIDLAGICETLGDLDKARKSYLYAMNLLIGRVQSVKGQDTAKPQKYRRNAFAYTTDDISRHQDLILAGLLRTLRTDRQKDDVLDSLMNQLAEHITQLEANELVAISGPDNPQMMQIAVIISKLFKTSIPRPTGVKKMFDMLVKKYPKDTGMQASADQFYKTLKKSDSLLDLYSNDSKLTIHILGSNLKRYQMVDALPKLVIMGKDTLVSDVIGQLLNETLAAPDKAFASGRRPAPPRVSYYSRPKIPHWPSQADSIVLAAAVAIDDTKSIEKFCEILPSACHYFITKLTTPKVSPKRGRSRGKKVKITIVDLAPMIASIDAAWSHLDSKTKEKLYVAMGDLNDDVAPLHRAQVELLRMQLGVKSPTIDQFVSITSAFTSWGKDWTAAANDSLEGSRTVVTDVISCIAIIVNNAKPSDRPALLARALDAIPSSNRQSIILDIACQLASDADNALTQVFVDFMRKSPSIMGKLTYWGRTIPLRYKLISLRAAMPALGEKLGEAFWLSNQTSPFICSIFALPVDDERVQLAAKKLFDHCVTSHVEREEKIRNSRYLSRKFWTESTLGSTVTAGRILKPQTIDEIVASLPARMTKSRVPEVVLLETAVLLFGAQRIDEAFEMAKSLIEKYPHYIDGRKILIFLARSACRSRELADTLKKHLPTVSGASVQGWAELSWTYLDLHDPRSALDASGHLGYSHPFYRSCEVLRAAVQLGDKQLAQREMARYAVATTKKTRDRVTFLVVTQKNDHSRFLNWPGAESTGGIAGFPPAKGSRLVLAPVYSLPGMAAEMIAYYCAGGETTLQQYRRFWHLGRTQPEELYISIAKSTKNTSDRETTIEFLVESKKKKGNLSEIGNHILLSIAVANPSAIPEELYDDLQEGILKYPWYYLEITAGASQSIVSDRPAFAKRLAKWAAISDAVCFGGAKYLDNYLKMLPAEKRKAEGRKILLAGSRSPLSALAGNDELRLGYLDEFATQASRKTQIDIAKRKSMSLINPPANRVGSDSISSRPVVANDSLEVHDPRFALGRCAAVDGDKKRFRSLVASSLIGWVIMSREISGGVVSSGLLPLEMAFGEPAFVSDIRRLLPSAIELGNPDEYVDIIIGEIKKMQKQGLLTRGDSVAGICLIGQWCVQNKRAEKAKQLLEIALISAKGIAAAQLWVADLARAAGQKAIATNIELALFKADKLAVLRIENLLNEVKESQGAQAARKLAIEAAKYTKLPGVIKWTKQ